MSEIEVRFYSGHRRASYPRALVIAGAEVLVESVLRHEISEDYATRRRQHLFICRVQGDLWEIIRYDDETTRTRQLGLDRRTS
jgi:hypothetical protein